MNALTIRAATKYGDRATLEACVVELQNFERKLDPDLPAGDEIADAYVNQMFENSRDYAGKIFIAELDGIAVGFVSIWARYRSEDIDDPGEYGLIQDVVVRDRYRGRGVGTKLLQTAESYARSQGATRLRIHVLATNKGARSLYQTLGFCDYTIELEKHLGKLTSDSE